MSYQKIQGFPGGATLYFIGIGGISMSGLAEIAAANGFCVEGSDFHRSEHVMHLEKLGIRVFIGHAAANIDAVRPDFVVYTAAIPKDNVELLRARALGIPCLERGEFLGRLTESFAAVVNIAGTHGKTTTTALTALLLMASQAEPTVHLGARLSAFDDSTVRLGRAGKLLVNEACEFNNSFLHFTSTTAVILNIDADHLDFFGDLDHVVDAFAAFAAKLGPEQRLILPAGDPNLPAFLAKLGARCAAARSPLPRLACFGTEEDFAGSELPEELRGAPRFMAEALRFEEGYPRFSLVLPAGERLALRLSVPGLHNVRDSLAALAAAYYNGLDPAAAAEVLASFTGADGRFMVNGHFRGALVISDYAHHPNAARATLEAAARLPHKKTYVVFQPLTFSRVKLLFDDFVSCLSDYAPDLVLFYEIFSDREQDRLGMSSRLLSEAYNARGLPSLFVEDFPSLVDALTQRVAEGDMLLFLGPEEVRDLGRALVENYGEARR